MPATRPAIVCATLGTLALALPVSVRAADDPRACVSVGDDAARLACYDKAFGRTAAAKPAAAPAATAGSHRSSGTATSGATAGAATAATASQAATAPPPRNPTAEFGLNEAQKRAKDPVKAAEPPPPDSITGRVISVGWRKYGEFVVTLDNGQVWEQNQPEPSAIVKVGDTVSIRKGWLGSYMLVTAGKVGTKVHRVD